MATIRIESQVTPDALLQAVGQLSAADLERVVAQVLRLQAQHKAASLSSRETELLLKINQGVPAAANARYQSLQSKRQAEQLTAEERRELSRLINQREKLQAQRLESLAELARLRNMTLRGVMKQLGIQSPGYA
ncbi:MAG: STAS/SEC14 domain-containing protein [Anaerolineae bacterium CG1_02_58_13]|nr:MAG: STAS/SEC14 domain-containing protein [Anaerolineae bacterium CG1_02_58_13]